MKTTDTLNVSAGRSGAWPSSIPHRVREVAHVLAALLCLTTAFERAARAGYLYVDDQAAGIVYRVDGSGNKTAFLSGLDFPTALAADNSGNIYLAAAGGIYEYSSNGTQSTFAHLGGMMGMAVNGSGDVFGSVLGRIQGESEVFEFTPSGQESLVYNLLKEPNAIAIDSSGDVFVADYGNGSSGTGSIREFFPIPSAPYFIESTYASGLNGADGLAFDKSADLFEDDGLTGTINEFTSSGRKLNYFSAGEQTNDLAIDPSGDLFVTAGPFGSGQVIEISPSRVESTFATGFENPVSLVYVAPEPTSLVLVVFGIAGVVGFRIVSFGTPLLPTNRSPREISEEVAR